MSGKQIDRLAECKILKEFEEMLEQTWCQEKSTPPPIPDKCKHQWKKVPGFNPKTIFYVCKKCKKDADSI